MSITPEAAAKAEDEERELYSLSHYWDASDEALLTCPFDPSHKVRRFRIERHLFLCKESHPEVKVATCPYNAAHVLPLKMYVEHVLGCPDIRIVDAAQGAVRADWTMKPRNFRASAALGVADAELEKYRMMTLPFTRQSTESVDKDGATKSQATGTSSEPIQSRSAKITSDLREIMKTNLKNDEGGANFVENCIIAGGVPSLVSGGGVIEEVLAPENSLLSQDPQNVRDRDERHTPKSLEDLNAVSTAKLLRMRGRGRPFSGSSGGADSGQTAPF